MESSDFLKPLLEWIVSAVVLNTNVSAMSLVKKVNLIIYRFRERGLEVFMVNPTEDDLWEIPQGKASEEKAQTLMQTDRLIELDPVQKENGHTEEGWAVEGEWHDIPSLKHMLYEDALYMSEKLKNLDKGTFISVKEALKKALPHQYKFLKELKDILRDRNSVKDI
jgi:hypothetical protein